MAALPNPTTMRAWHTFLQAHALITERLEVELQLERDLGLNWYDVLVQLSQARDGRLRMTELAAAVLLSKSGLTRLIDRMNGEGLVERQPDPGDKRGTYVQLTTTGLRRLQAAAPIHLRGIQEHFGAAITEAEAESLATALSKVVNALAHSRTVAVERPFENPPFE
ncbi:MAG: MarR family transcriptional regulator [Tepidiformaceae bacterium]